MDSVCEIVLDGPGKNALSAAMLRSLDDRLAEAGDRAVLLRGAGDAFSAGLDLKEVGAASADADAMFEHLRALDRTMAAFYTHPAPVVACVNGHAIAGGCVLALTADVRVATRSPTAKIGLNEVALGVELPPHVLAIVVDRVAPKARDLVLLTGELFSPEDALRHGLVDELADDPLERARARAARVAALPRAAYASTKRALRRPLAAPEEHERRLRAALGAWTSPELRRRVLAQLERPKRA